jgi:hypothetical protein
LIFILSTGADPSVEVQNLAAKLNMKNNLKMLSLGQGQVFFIINLREDMHLPQLMLVYKKDTGFSYKIAI